ADELAAHETGQRSTREGIWVGLVSIRGLKPPNDLKGRAGGHSRKEWHPRNNDILPLRYAIYLYQAGRRTPWGEELCPLALQPFVPRSLSRRARLSALHTSLRL